MHTLRHTQGLNPGFLIESCVTSSRQGQLELPSHVCSVELTGHRALLPELLKLRSVLCSPVDKTEKAYSRQSLIQWA